jgi:D-glycero-alpha-D-manno-heptose-7-phosphate kinase
MIVARSPFRITLGGGGTDLPSYYSLHGGFILSAAINKYSYIYVNRPAADDYIRLKYSRYEQVTSPDELQHDLVRPALNLLGFDKSIEIVSMADIPAGTGLGSSGSYLVTLLTALYELKREKVPVQVLAEQASYIETELAAHPHGKQDHYLAAFGGITTLDIDPDGRVHISPLDISLTTVEDFRSDVLLFYTGIIRSSTDIMKEQIHDTDRSVASVVDSLHRTKELGYRVKEALEQGDLERFGLLLHEHWENKKRRSGRITNPNIDAWYELARENGVLGGKIMGAGGGGFFLFYCPKQCKAAVRQALLGAGLREISYDFDFEGTKVLVNF